MKPWFVDYYSILEIDPTNDIRKIKKAYRKQSLKNHPDANNGCDDTKMKIINIVYENLNNEVYLNNYYEYYNDYKNNDIKKYYPDFNDDSIISTESNEEKEYKEYVVKKSDNEKENIKETHIEKNSDEVNYNSFNKNNKKLKVFFNNFKKNVYVLKTLKVLGVIGTIAITFNFANSKKIKNENIKEEVIKTHTIQIDEDLANYELIRNYKVKKGDNLYNLSNKIGTSIDKIKEINDLNNNTIYYDTILKLPYEVDKNDLDYYTKNVNVNNNSIYDLANKYNTTNETIYNLNKEAIININGEYIILSKSLKMPNFIDKKELETIKNDKNAKILTK